MTNYQEDFDIVLDRTDIDKQIKRLRNIKNGAEKALTRGMNTALPKMKKAASNSIKQNYSITKITAATKTIKQKKAAYKRLSAEINSQGRPIPLTSFRFKRNPHPGVKGTPTAKAMVVKNGALKETGGFMANVRWRSKTGDSGSHTGIFKRVGKERYPIKQLYAPSTTEFMNNPDSSTNIQKAGQESFEKEFDRQVDYLLKGGK